MIEVLFAAWLGAVGALVLAPASRAIHPWGAAFLAPIAATAITTFSGLVLVAVGSYTVVVSVVISTVAALAIVVLAFGKQAVTADWITKTLVGSVSLAVVVAAVAWFVPMARFTSDSYHYLMSALALGRSGTLEGVIDAYLLKRELATPLLHTLGVLTGRGYVSFWTPLLGVATFGSLTWIAVTGLRLMSVARKWQWAILVPALVFVLTTNRVLFHFFYINGHMLFAGLLLGGVGLAWLATQTREWTLLLPASLMFGALIPTRAESAIVVGAFLVVLLTSRQIPIRWRWILLIPTVAATLVWDVVVLPRLLSETSLELMKSPIGEVIIVSGLIVLLAVASAGRLVRIVQAAPWITIGAFAAILGGLILRRPQIMIDTIDGMSTAMSVTGLWGTFWFVVPFLVFGAAIVGFRSDRYVLLGLFAFALIIPILAYLRGSRFHEGPGDSANRMLMHIVPLLLLAIIMAAGTAVRALQGSEKRTQVPAASPSEDDATKPASDSSGQSEA